MKHFLKNIETDWSTLRDSVEQEIVTDSMDAARHLITIFLCKALHKYLFPKISFSVFNDCFKSLSYK